MLHPNPNPEPPTALRIAGRHGLNAANGAIGLPGSSDAEAALASRMDVRVGGDFGVVKTLVEGGGLGHFALGRSRSSSENRNEGENGKNQTNHCFNIWKNLQL